MLVHSHTSAIGIQTDLRRRNTNLRTRVDVNTTVSFTRDCRADGVHNTDAKSTTLQAVTEGQDAVSRLTTLADEHTDIITEDRCLPVQEVRRKLDGDGNLCELLEDGARSNGRMVAGSAGAEDDPTTTPDNVEVGTKATKGDEMLVEVDTTTHGVDDRLGLLVNLLLHEVVELALHDLRELNLEGFDGTVLGFRNAAFLVAAETMDMQLTLGDVGNVIVLKVKNTLGVLDYRRGIGGDEEFDRLREAVLRHERTGLRAEHAGARRGNEEATRRRRRG